MVQPPRGGGIRDAVCDRRHRQDVAGARADHDADLAVIVVDGAQHVVRAAAHRLAERLEAGRAQDASDFMGRQRARLEALRHGRAWAPHSASTASAA